jgi:hypothetical protein
MKRRMRRSAKAMWGRCGLRAGQLGAAGGWPARFGLSAGQAEGADEPLVDLEKQDSRPRHRPAVKFLD